MDTPPPPEASPMVAAYAAARATAPGHLVLYRVGEFYEVLQEDAATVSRLLGIQLTRRRQKNAPDIPMCGIPAGSADTAIARLLAARRKVAVSEQPSEPAGERPLRLMTPGTSVDADVLTPGKPNTLAVAHAEGEAVALAWTDLSTGEAGTCMASLGGCAAALARIVPSEILVSRWPDGSDALALAVRGSGARFSDLPGDGLPPDEADAVLAQAYGPGWREALRGFSPAELTAHAALLDYVQRVAGALPASLPLPRRVSAGDTMEIDGPTLRGLDVLTSGSGRDGSLLSVMDRTLTAPGARLLVRQLSAPLTDPATIGRRLAMVRCFVVNPGLRADCRDALGGLPDILRACGRLSLGKAGPRDLAAVRDGLDRASALGGKLEAATDLPPGLATVARDLGGSLGRLLRRPGQRASARARAKPSIVPPGAGVHCQGLCQAAGCLPGRDRPCQGGDRGPAGALRPGHRGQVAAHPGELGGRTPRRGAGCQRAEPRRGVHAAPGAGLVHALQHARAGQPRRHAGGGVRPGEPRRAGHLPGVVHRRHGIPRGR